MDERSRAVCPENERLVEYMWKKGKEMAEGSKGLSENVERTLHKAYSNVCNCKTPIGTIRDFAEIKGVGKWIVKLMKGFFDADSDSSENEEFSKKGKKTKGAKRYMPQKNSVAYALLITLYRGTKVGKDFMRKQELIDSAEASGLSRAPIAPELGKGKTGQFGNSPREWYSGWSCIKTLISRGLVVKSSCPAKYMLTEEGKGIARDCLLRSGLLDTTEDLVIMEGQLNVGQSNKVDMDVAQSDSIKEALPSIGSRRQEKSIDVPPESLNRFLRMGYSKEQIVKAFAEVLEKSQNQDISQLWLPVLCQLKKHQLDGLPLESLVTLKEDQSASLATHKYRDENVEKENRKINLSFHETLVVQESTLVDDHTQRSFGLRACSSMDPPINKQGTDDLAAKSKFLAMPPLRVGERFEDAYDVILVLDSREKFAAHSSRSWNIVQNICIQFRIQIEVRQLPVGDGIWIARHKHLGCEYVLDFIVERKKVDDLRLSIRDNRYKDQKLRLLRCGLKKMIYVVEGDPNASEAAESIKTACFTTELLEGFDVQRTSGLRDTLRRYGYLTLAITAYYRSLDAEDKQRITSLCPYYKDFIKRCQDLEKMTVSDVFAIQLMQVPYVTEEVAVAVLDMYPTVLSLARAYSLLDGDIRAQEDMLKMESNNVISGQASRNIFRLIWGT